MKLNGGDFLLDLTGITLVSDTSTTISDVSIIKQLTGLKTYINNQKAIKPIYVKVIDDGEVVVARGETRKTISELTFELFVKFKSKSITINVEFTQLLDDDNNPLDDYYIASGDASYVYIANSEDPNNVKPIYCHPIEIRANNSLVNICVTMLIFTNNSTPFTLNTFKQWLDDLYNAVGVTRILCSGGCLLKSNNTMICTSFLYEATISYGFVGMTPSGTIYDIEKNKESWNDLFENAILNDGVNKIN